MSPETELFAAMVGAIEAGIPRDTPIRCLGLTHYVNESSSDDWRREMIAMETEGERTPVQTDPIVFDESLPALLRRQAA